MFPPIQMRIFYGSILFFSLLILSNGECPTAPLFAFIQNSTILTTISTNGQYHLSYVGSYNKTATNGSYVPMKCKSGYILASGQLNITCIGSNWTIFPTCKQTNTKITQKDTVPCTVNVTTTFALTNGYISDASGLSLLSDTSAIGSLVFACYTGYALDPSVGGTYKCNNGVWSTKPTCLLTGRCSLTQLQTFLNTTTGIMTTGQSQLIQVSGDTTTVVNGSYIVLACYTGYTNTGGSLNVTCSTTNSWSQFPSCVANPGAVTTTTTVASGGGSGATCAVDMSSTFTIANGFLNDTSTLSLQSSTAATGSVVFACYPGYVFNPSVGGRYTCNNGVWSTKPTCLITGRCSLTQLNTFLNTSTGIMTTGQSQLVQVSGDTTTVVNGSYIVLACYTGYTNTGGSLNVTCSTTNSWSQFPSCVSSGQATNAVTTTSVTQGVITTIAYSSTCATVPGVSNAHISSASGITLTNGKYERTVVFTCNPGYSHVSTSGQLTVSCANGVWGTLPSCSESPTCLKDKLEALFTTGISIESHLLRIAKAGSTDILIGSWIKLVCSGNYKWNSASGALNVTCLTTGEWSPAPTCYL